MFRWHAARRLSGGVDASGCSSRSNVEQWPRVALLNFHWQMPKNRAFRQCVRSDGRAMLADSGGGGADAGPAFHCRPSPRARRRRLSRRILPCCRHVLTMVRNFAVSVRGRKKKTKTLLR